MRPARAAGARVSAAGPGDGFAAGRGTFESVVGFLDGTEAAGMEHAELEAELDTRGREPMRRLRQDHLDLRAGREERLDAVTDTEGVPRTRAESGHTRALTSVFGEVTVTRWAYRAPERANLHPADAAGEPTRREALPRPAAPGRDRGRARLGRHRGGRGRPGHRRAAGQTPGRGARHRDRAFTRCSMENPSTGDGPLTNGDDRTRRFRHDDDNRRGHEHEKQQAGAGGR